MKSDIPRARLLLDAPARSEDAVVLNYEERMIRRKLLTSTRGTAFLVDLPNVTNLDAVWGFELENHLPIRIEPADEAVAVVTGDLPRLAWHIGNRHTPCQILPDRLIIRQDHVLENMVLRLGAIVTHATLPFTPDGGAYGFGRTMGHEHDHDHN